jgi:hypothetical protein
VGSCVEQPQCDVRMGGSCAERREVDAQGSFANHTCLYFIPNVLQGSMHPSSTLLRCPMISDRAGGAVIFIGGWSWFGPDAVALWHGWSGRAHDEKSDLLAISLWRLARMGDDSVTRKSARREVGPSCYLIMAIGADGR